MTTDPKLTVYRHAIGLHKLPFDYVAKDKTGRWLRFALGRWWAMSPSQAVEHCSRVENGVWRRMTDKERLAFDRMNIKLHLYAAFSDDFRDVAMVGVVEAGLAVVHAYVDAPDVGRLHFKATEVDPLMSEFEQIDRAYDALRGLFPNYSPNRLRPIDSADARLFRRVWASGEAVDIVRSLLKSYYDAEQIEEFAGVDAGHMSATQFARIFSARAHKSR